MGQEEQKDPNVYSFLMQVVQEKHGDDVDAEFLNIETERLYIDFGQVLLQEFEPMLSQDQAQEFNTLVENQASQEEIMMFLTHSVDNLEEKVLEILMKYKSKYLDEND